MFDHRVTPLGKAPGGSAGEVAFKSPSKCCLGFKKPSAPTGGFSMSEPSAILREHIENNKSTGLARHEPRQSLGALAAVT